MHWIILAISIIILLSICVILFCLMIKCKKDLNNCIDNYELCIQEREKYKNEVERLNNNLQFYTKYNKNSDEYNNKLQDQHIKDTSKLYENFANEKVRIEQELNNIVTNANLEIQQICNNLNKYKRLQDAINKEYIEREEKIQQANFYHITLDQTDLHDINILKSIIPQLYKSGIIYDIIFKNYYDKKLNDLFKQILNKSDAIDKGGIYRITDITNNKIYIGQATNFQKRWKDHIKDFRDINKKDDVSTRKLYEAMQNHGIENFMFEVVQIIDDKNERCEQEKYYIDYFKSNIIGYNMTIGG